MVRPHDQSSNHPEDNVQGMQTTTMEAIRQMVREAVLQVIKDVYSPRMAMIEQVSEGLTLSINKNRERESTVAKN